MKLITNLIKFIFKLIFWIIVFALILGVILYFSAGLLIEKLAPSFISDVTGTPTELGKVDISLFSGRVALNDLAIGNPAGFKDKNALQLKQVAVDFEPKSVLTDKIIVNSVKISGTTVSTELNAKGKTNVGVLLENINAFTAANEQAPATTQTPQTAPQAKAEKSAKSVVIRDLTIEDSTVRAGIAGNMQTIPLPNIHQQNIGENKKQTLAQTVTGILNTLNSESAKATLNAGKETLQNALSNGKETLKNLKSGFKNMF